MFRRRTAPTPAPVVLAPAPSNLLRVVPPDEVPDAKAEARALFERVLAASDLRPNDADLERWYT